MTRPSPRPRAGRSGPAGRVTTVLLLTALLAAMGACGGGNGSSGPSAPPSDTVVAPPGPSATPWPSLVMDGVLALGASDAELWKAAADIARAADAEDVQAMWGAADGTVKMLEGLMPNIVELESYPHTAELGAGYRASFPVMLEGATQIRDSITAGDPAGVVEGSERLADGVRLYSALRPSLETYVKEAASMKDTLVQ